MLARGAVVRVHADGLRQESAALNEPVTAAVTCGRALVGAPGLTGDLPSVARGVPSWMALHLGNPDFGAGRADPDVAVEATGRRSRGLRPAIIRPPPSLAPSSGRHAHARCPPGTSAEGPIGDTGVPVDARPGPPAGRGMLPHQQAHDPLTDSPTAPVSATARSRGGWRPQP